MHPLGQNGYGGYGMEGAGLQQPTSPHTNGTEDEGSKYSDINSILDQILNITDQSLDEAQVYDIILEDKEIVQGVYSSPPPISSPPSPLIHLIFFPTAP